MKGMSPLVAIVLLIGFTVAVAGIISVWITGTTRTQTEIIGEQADIQAKCVGSTLVVKEVRRNGAQVNVTFLLETGTEPLKNVTVEATALGNTTKFGPMFLNTTALAPGESNSTSFTITPVGSLELVRVRGYCQDKFPIIGECKSSRPCMVLN